MTTVVIHRACSALLLLAPAWAASQRPASAPPSLANEAIAGGGGYCLVPLGRVQHDTTCWRVERRAEGLQVMVATGHGRTTTDSVRFDPGTLALISEWSSVPSDVRVSGSRVTGTVGRGAALKRVNVGAPGLLFSSTMDNLVVERLPLTDGYRSVLAFWAGDHLERDTVQVRGGGAGRWVVDFAEPYAVETLWIESAPRRISRHLYTWRRDGTQSEVVSSPSFR